MKNKQPSIGDRLASSNLEEQRNALAEIIASTTPSNILQAIAQSSAACSAAEDLITYIAHVKE